ncbi:MAG: hypothetical protein WC997_04450 [Porticoccaceae bacterium]
MKRPEFLLRPFLFSGYRKAPGCPVPSGRIGKKVRLQQILDFEKVLVLFIERVCLAVGESLNQAGFFLIVLSDQNNCLALIRLVPFSFPKQRSMKPGAGGAAHAAHGALPHLGRNTWSEAE